MPRPLTGNRTVAPEQTNTDTATVTAKLVLYRGPWLLLFRLLVRFEIAQLGCVAALSIPVHTLVTQVSIVTAEFLAPSGPSRQRRAVIVEHSGYNTFLTASLLQGSVDSIQLAVTSVLFVGCAAVSTTLFYLSRRYIGELALLSPNHNPRLCISTLDFWGNRQVSCACECRL